MKKILNVFFIMILFISISSCNNKELEPKKEINAFFLNTGYVKQVTSNTFKIKSRDELDQYINESIYLVDNVSTFNQKTNCYDDEYFNDKSLVIIVFKEISSSYKYEVLDYNLNDSLVLNIEIKRIKPNNGDEAMSGWHLVLEVETSMLNKAQFINFKFTSEGTND